MTSVAEERQRRRAWLQAQLTDAQRACLHTSAVQFVGSTLFDWKMTCLACGQLWEATDRDLVPEYMRPPVWEALEQNGFGLPRGWDVYWDPYPDQPDIDEVDTAEWKPVAPQGLWALRSHVADSLSLPGYEDSLTRLLRQGKGTVQPVGMTPRQAARALIADEQARLHSARLFSVSAP